MEQNNLIRANRQKITYTYRKMTRQQLFSKNRNFKKQAQYNLPSYLDDFDQQSKQQIIKSLVGEIPNSLPPLSTTSISYYRRNSFPVYMTSENKISNPHLIHESLWILSSIESQRYQNYPEIVMQFQRQLPSYLQSKYQEIRQMAIIVAGNKYIGKEKQIIKIAENDQLWVLINHVYQNKIHYSIIFKGIIAQNSNCFRCIYQLSNHKIEVLKSLTQLEHRNVLRHIIYSLRKTTDDIHIYSLRIIGNLLSDKQQYTDVLLKEKILQELYIILFNQSSDLKQEVCWVISNIACGTELQSTAVLTNEEMIKKLMSMLSFESAKVKIEIMHIFSNLIRQAKKEYIYEFLIHGDLLEKMRNLYNEQDIELSTITTNALLNIIELGDKHFLDEDNQNIFIKIIERFNFKSIIYNFTFIDSNKILSDLSSKVMDFLQE